MTSTEKIVAPCPEILVVCCLDRLMQFMTGQFRVTDAVPGAPERRRPRDFRQRLKEYAEDLQDRLRVWDPPSLKAD